ncbi:MAG: hypothetical protein K1X81_13955 [Bacteroidia bacterium]|nr:hypothetical protein [Bacteroidia bacterium]
MRHIKLLLLIASLSCLSLHCKKESELDKLPPATAIGANTFGCLMNGKAWPMGRGGYHYNYIFYELGVLHIHYAIKINEHDPVDNEWLSFTTNKIHTPGFYFVPFTYDTDFFSVNYNNVFYRTGAVGVPNGMAYITISRLDSSNNIVSGTFDFSLYNQEGTKKIKVSSGRFDFHY